MCLAEAGGVCALSVRLCKDRRSSHEPLVPMLYAETVATVGSPALYIVDAYAICVINRAVSRRQAKAAELRSRDRARRRQEEAPLAVASFS